MYDFLVIVGAGKSERFAILRKPEYVAATRLNLSGKETVVRHDVDWLPQGPTVGVRICS